MPSNSNEKVKDNTVFISKLDGALNELKILCFPIALKKKDLDFLAAEQDEKLFVTLHVEDKCATFRLNDKRDFTLDGFKKWLNS